MNKPKFTSHIITVAAVIVLGSISIFSQPIGSSAQSYEATLYVVIGSNDDARRADLPKSLVGVAKLMHEKFSFNSYHLMNTYYGRLIDGGSLEFKSVSSLNSESPELNAPSFLDWHLTNFNVGNAEAGKDTLSLQAFRFGARVPVVVATVASGGGANTPVRNYESVGLTLNKLAVSSGVPTLIGTISLPRTTGTVLLVMEIKPV